MEALPAVFLGLVQGVTEFLPVSSSGHLALFQQLFGIGEAALSYDLLLHFATMLATLVFFGKDVALLLCQWCRGLLSAESRTAEGWTFGWAVIAGTVLTGAIGLSLKPLVERAMTLPWAVGAGLLVTAAVLWYGSSLATDLCGRPVTPARGLVVGIVQGIAVLPGISRSGSTIVTGMKTGLSAPSAFRFSFLLSLPAIFGATLLEMKDLLQVPDWSSTLPSGWAAGTAAAFFSGLVSLAVLRRLVTRGKWRPFAAYCAFVGLLALAIFPGR